MSFEYAWNEYHIRQSCEIPYKSGIQCTLVLQNIRSEGNVRSHTFSLYTSVYMQYGGGVNGTKLCLQSTIPDTTCFIYSIIYVYVWVIWFRLRVWDGNDLKGFHNLIIGPIKEIMVFNLPLLLFSNMIFPHWLADSTRWICCLDKLFHVDLCVTYINNTSPLITAEAQQMRSQKRTIIKAILCFNNANG